MLLTCKGETQFIACSLQKILHFWKYSRNLLFNLLHKQEQALDFGIPITWNSQASRESVHRLALSIYNPLILQAWPCKTGATEAYYIPRPGGGTFQIPLHWVVCNLAVKTIDDDGSANLVLLHTYKKTPSQPLIYSHVSSRKNGAI